MATLTVTECLERLGTLDASLRENGFAPDPASWLRIHDLVTALALAGRLPPDLDGLRALLAPLLCGSKEQQEDFKRIFERWAKTPEAAFVLSSAVDRDGALATAQRRVVRATRAWPAMAMIATAVVVALAVGIQRSGVLHWADRTLNPPPAARPTPPPPRPETTPSPSLADADAARAAAMPIAPVPPRALAVRDDPATRFISEAMRACLLVLPSLLALAWLIRRWLQRRAVLRRQPAQADDPTLHLTLRGGNRRPFWGGAVPRVLPRLRRSVPVEIRDLDVRRTVDRTVRNAGLFVPVRARRHWQPEYLLLIDRTAGSQHTAGLADALYARLVADDLVLARYDYDGDPAFCHDVAGPRRGQRFRLNDLAERHAGARLLIVGDGRELFHPLTSEPMPTLAALAAWQDRVWLTPRPAPWGQHEFQLAQAGFAVAPLSGLGVEAACRWFERENHSGAASWFEPPVADPLPAALRLDPAAWLAPRPPHGADLPALTTALHHHLGTAGMRLLRAIAFYPKIHTTLSIALDERLFPAHSAQDRERRLLRVSRLPWCRYGAMPDYWRLHLLSGLSANERGRLASAYQDLFDGVAGAAPHAMSVPLRVRSRHRVSRAWRLRLRDARPGSALDDPIFANLFLGGRLGLLDFKLPRALASLLPNPRWPLGPLLAATLCTAVCTWGTALVWQAGLNRLLQSPLAAVSTWLHRQFVVDIKATTAGETLAGALAVSLQGAGFVTADAVQPGNSGAPLRVTAPTSAMPAPAVNTIEYGSAWARLGAAEVADFLARLMYRERAPAGAWSASSAATNLGWRDIRVWVVQAPQGGPDAVFRDRLVNEWVPAPEPAAANLGPISPAMVTIPGGRFRMGAPVDEAGSSEDERPVHEVSVKTFALGVTEVTFEEYAAFAQATKRALPDDSGWGRGRQPVINVSHADAQAYAAWLSSQTGETYRLPTEAEWEYAARGGSDAAYWWGNEIRRGSEVMANCNGCGSQWDNKQAAPVRQFAANPYGLHDMHGNVWEWTQDCWHENYEGAPSDGRAWESQGKEDCGWRVVRGGSWEFIPETQRSANRDRGIPGGAGRTLGFRLARTLP